MEPAHANFRKAWLSGTNRKNGLFHDPASDYGRLNLELMRAVRLVVDTGIHAKGWSREQAVAYYRQSGATDEPTTQSEVDMCIARPGRSLAYQIGKLKILELRRSAEQRLGTRFDLRTFHDQILRGGPMPLDLLSKQVDAWIAQQS